MRSLVLAAATEYMAASCDDDPCGTVTSRLKGSGLRDGNVYIYIHIWVLVKIVVPFLDPYYDTAPIGYPKRGQNFDNHPYVCMQGPLKV